MMRELKDADLDTLIGLQNNGWMQNLIEDAPAEFKRAAEKKTGDYLEGYIGALLDLVVFLRQMQSEFVTVNGETTINLSLKMNAMGSFLARLLKQKRSRN